MQSSIQSSIQSQFDFAHTREARVHGTPQVPFGLYENRLPEMVLNVPAHWHEEFELNLVRSGDGVLLLDGERYAARPGAVLLIPPNVLHAAYPEKGGCLRYDALVFRPSLLGGGVDRSVTGCIGPLARGQFGVRPPVTPDAPGYPAFAACADRVFSAARKDTARDDLLLKSGLLELVYLLTEGVPASPRPEPPDNASVRPALSYMAEHYMEPVTVEALAACCNLSKSYFMACFKRAAGMSAIEHLTQLRIRAACEALSRTGKSVSEIAADCGYQNLSGFNRQFRRLTGCSPKQYRQAAQKEGAAAGSALSPSRIP